MSTKPEISWSLNVILSLLSNVTDFARRSNGTVNRRLLSYLDVMAKGPPQTVNGVKTSDVTVDPTRNLWFRLYVPTDHVNDPSISLPVIVYFHGGGFTFMSADTNMYDWVCRKIARHVPAVVVSVNYRLSPEYRYPSQYDDGFDTLKFLDRGDIEGFPRNADVSRCFMAGDSAGGNLGHHVARRYAERVTEFNKLRAIGLIAIQPFFGGEERTGSETRLDGLTPIVNLERCDWHWKVFLPEGSGSDRDHEVINVFGPNAVDISGLKDFPVTLVVIGGYDPLQDWQRRYYEGLKMSGINARLLEYPGGIHCFFLFSQLPQGSLLITELKNFVHEVSRNLEIK
ncbi:hypothetical protein GIB67_000871 [Kingdonia uniflora]|uniref:Alpha/beta hydrolase fold-3 domain-containing protein n=1 Tax=Kingdonia uniflora TaxID=39325 RepID=A0A7J7LG31_9MAGN|nr:hypothetical protein GIB67_000871 [Kingdonia uniflora]